MAEVKDKIITVESLKALHDYNEGTFLKKDGALTTIGIDATATELNYIKGATSNIQTQINNLSTPTPIVVGTPSINTTNNSYQVGNIVTVNLFGNASMTKDTNFDIGSGFPVPFGINNDNNLYYTIAYVYNNDVRYITQASINVYGSVYVLCPDDGDFNFIVDTSYITTVS